MLSRGKPGGTIEEILRGGKKKVAIITPAHGGFSYESLEKAARLLEEKELEVDRPLPELKPDLFFILPEQERAEQLVRAITSDEIDIIWAMRGGSGTANLLPFLPLTAPKKQKLLIGFSDLTSLHLYLNQNYGWCTMHSYVLNQLLGKNFKEEDFQAIMDYIYEKRSSFSYRLEKFNDHAEDISGELVGGNLAVLMTSLATPWQVDAKNKILFLEDIGEPGYRLYRSLMQLKHANILQHCQGIIFGDFIGKEEDLAGMNLAIENFAKSIELPCWRLKGAGHDTSNHPLLLGRMAKIENGILTCGL